MNRRDNSRSRSRKVTPSSHGGAAAGLEFEARRVQRLKTVELLQKGRLPLHVLEVADKGAALAEQSIETARLKQPPRPPIACAEGCAWCCHKRVGVSAVEILRIAAFLRAGLSTVELQI